MHYTGYASKKVDAQIEEDLGAISSAVQSGLKDNLVSLVLVGGFGRGEGSVKIVKDKVVPLNDYDLYAITKKPVPDEKLDQIAKQAESKTGTSGYSMHKFSQQEYYFDLRNIRLSSLSKLPPLVKYYEMKQSGTVLAGENVLGKINIKKQDLPASEGARFLLNRASHILEWFTLKHFSGISTDSEKEMIRYNSIKAYLSCCTALLLLRKKFEPSYSARAALFSKIYEKQFPELAEELPELPDHVNYATSMKLKPDLESIDIVDFWLQTRKETLTVLQYFLKEFTGNGSLERLSDGLCKKYFNPYAEFYMKQKLGIRSRTLARPVALGMQQYLNWKWFKRMRAFKSRSYPRALFSMKDAGIRIFDAMPHILKSVNEDGTVNANMVKRGLSCLSKVYPTGITAGTVSSEKDLYEQARIAYADAWRLYFFQKITEFK